MPLLGILLLHLLLSATFTSLIPLGEAPDEPAHLRYVQFIANKGHLPATPAQRQEAGYRSPWPPLYHLMAAIPVAIIGDAPPSRLKSVGDTPRRLIPTNGQTIASFIHTEDETWPWRGITLAWHLGRLVSLTSTVLTVIVTYIIAWRLSGRQSIALSSTALYAFMPQVLFIGGALNDDNLLFLVSGLIFLALIVYTQRGIPPKVGQTFILGILLGLATVAKYNALPLWAFVPIWLGWLIIRPYLQRTASRNMAIPDTSRTFGRLPEKLIIALPVYFMVLLIGAAVSAGWWFIFVWHHFNKVESMGLFRGSLAALAAGSSGVSGNTLQQLGSGISITVPAPNLWLEWITTFFKSFWGLYGGGGSIELPGWIYWLLAIICVIAVGSAIGYWVSIIRKYRASPSTTTIFLIMFPLFFLILPVLRFVMSGGNIIETAQGRHLFPTLPAIIFILIWGISRLSQRATRATLYVSLFIFFTLALSLYSLFLIHSSYPPPIPLNTTPDADTVEQRLDAKLVEEITLVGYELGQARAGMLPITLVWQANSIPTQDYMIDLTLTGSNRQTIGSWLGHPVGGRYPTRAWDEEDILRDHIRIPFWSQPDTEATLTLRLLDTTRHPVSEPVILASKLKLLDVPPLPHFPDQLRADGLPRGEPFSYRGTLSFSLTDTPRPELISPDGQTFMPAAFIADSNNAIAHFIVGSDWPNGNYQLSMNNYQLSIPISNRVRQFDPPPMQHTLNANFAAQITLLGYDLPQRRVQPGDSFPITLHLRAERTMGQNLVIFNHLLDREAIQHGGADRTPQNYYTTLLWVPGEIVSDAYDVPVQSTAPPGVYWLDVGLYPSDQPSRSLRLIVDGQSIDRTSVGLSPVKVGGPPPSVTIPEAYPQHGLDISFGSQGQIILLGFDLSNAADKPIYNSPLTVHNSELTLYWQPTTMPYVDYTVFIHILDSGDDLVAQADSPPAAGSYPTSLWDPGEIIVDAHPLPDLPPGRYRLRVGLYRADTSERLPAAGSPDGAVQLIEFEVGE